MHLNTFFKHLMFTLGLGGAFSGYALTAVGSKDCRLFKGTSKPFVLVLKSGESIMSAITQCSIDAHLSSASVSGVGALIHTTIAHKAKKNHLTTYPQYLELNSLLGLIATDNGKPDLHFHVTLSGEDNGVIGGHLIDGQVGATAEIIITPLLLNIDRKLNSGLGIKLISLK